MTGGDFDLNNVADRLKAAINMYGKTQALKLEAEAKQKAPWAPVGPGTPYYQITGLARSTIQGEHKIINNESVIRLSGNMPYSIFLELAMNKKYAILEPTINKHAKSIFKGYQELIK